jgi:Domain of unknown function (DUF4126)
VELLETLVSVAVGIGLAAAAGFRVFVPLLVVAVAARTGQLPLATDFSWLATTPALVALATATVLEILAYYIPWLDHVFDTLATPAAVLAGVVASAAVMIDLPPVLKWGISIIAGGGVAGLVQGATVLARLKSTVTTAGLANPVVATVELVGSLLTSLLTLVVPLLVLGLVILFCVAIFTLSHRVVFGRRRARKTPPDPQTGGTPLARL